MAGAKCRDRSDRREYQGTMGHNFNHFTVIYNVTILATQMDK